ncbi:hypothetical protein SK069_14615 [Patulibacter brassicae]|uniref:Flagellar biosynthesis protein FlhF n=1 Tax=Patulibacter brassicae TaxID=1705717 RepID=A0ABU4VLW3_9ACTN|nr:hypothetical protein [Patulibacter brassicae]MDX8152831.1 hypothetical protein [Patulibacter brassicae]
MTPSTSNTGAGTGGRLAGGRPGTGTARRPGGPTAHRAATTDAGPVRRYRGRSLEELLPRICEELGDDAVILRRREGLAGGVGGFFQQRYIEVEAAPGDVVAGAGPGGHAVDFHDGEPALPGLLDGRAFVDELRRASTAPDVAPPHEQTWDDEGEWGPVAPARTARPWTPPLATPPSATAPSVGVPRAAAPSAGPARAVAPSTDARPAAAPRPRHPVEVRDPVEQLLVPPATASAPTTGAPTVAPPAGAAPAVRPWRPARVPTTEREPFGPADAFAEIGQLDRQLEELHLAGVETPFDVAAVPMAPAPSAADALLPGHAYAMPVAAPREEDPHAQPQGEEASRIASDVAEYGLVARGLPPLLARRIVSEAVRLALPLEPGRRLERAVRSTLARRIPVLGDRTETTSLAIAGTPGSDRQALTVALARAHVAAGQRVLVVGLHVVAEPESGDAGLACRLHGVDAEVLRGRPTSIGPALEREEHDVVLLDLPVADPDDRDEVVALVEALEELRVAEVHLALPATAPAPAVAQQLDALAPLAPDALAITAMDRGARPGTLVGAAVERALPLSYVATSEAAVAASAARLARMVCP